VRATGGELERDRRADEIRELLETRGSIAVRGPAGIGKSTLLAAYERRFGARYDAVFCCDLAGVTDETDAVSRLAQAAGVPESNEVDKTLAVLLGAMSAAGTVLFSIDHADLALGAAERLANAIASRARNVHLLVGMRATTDAIHSFEVRAPSDAASMFASLAGVSLGRDGAVDGLVQGVVAALRSNPLALRLAAARVEALGLETVHRFLVEAPGTLLAADEAVARVVDETLRDLDEVDRAIVAGLACCRGGACARVVAALTGEPLGSIEPRLRSLARLGVLETTADRSSPTRFELPSLVREYVTPHTTAALERRHAEVFERLARPLAEARRERDRSEAKLVLAGDASNLEIALVRLPALDLPANEKSVIAIHLAIALDAVTHGARLRGKARAALDQAIANATAEVPLAVVGRGLCACAGKELYFGDCERALVEATSAYEIGEMVRDEWLVAHAALARSVALSGLFRCEEACAAGAEAERRFHDLGDPYWEALSARMIAFYLIGLGRRAEAAEAIARATRLCDTHQLEVERPVVELAAAANRIEDAPEWAMSALETIADGLAASGRLNLEMVARAHVGAAALECDDLFRAREAFGRAISLAHRNGATRYLGSFYAADAGVRALAGMLSEAERSWSRALPLLEEARWLDIARPYEGLLSLGRAAALGERGDVEGARAERDGAEAIEAACRDATSGPSLVSRDFVVRVGHRALVRALRDPARVRIARIERLEIASDYSWFRFAAAKPVVISRRRVVRRVLRALAEKRLESPEEPVSTEEVFAEGWPNETIRRESAQNRVHVAISTLRKLGLGEAIDHRRGGYVLLAAIRFARSQ
jgi:hypothetical protein